MVYIYKNREHESDYEADGAYLFLITHRLSYYFADILRCWLVERLLVAWGSLNIAWTWKQCGIKHHYNFFHQIFTSLRRKNFLGNQLHVHCCKNKLRVHYHAFISRSYEILTKIQVPCLVWLMLSKHTESTSQAIPCLKYVGSPSVWYIKNVY